MHSNIITILEAQVPESRWGDLHAAYQRVVNEPAAMMPMRSVLVQDTKEPTRWKIITEWKDKETLQAMRASGETPQGVRIFREAGAEPVLSILETRERL